MTRHLAGTRIRDHDRNMVRTGRVVPCPASVSSKSRCWGFASVSAHPGFASAAVDAVATPAAGRIWRADSHGQATLSSCTGDGDGRRFPQSCQRTGQKSASAYRYQDAVEAFDLFDKLGRHCARPSHGQWLVERMNQ